VLAFERQRISRAVGDVLSVDSELSLHQFGEQQFDPPCAQRVCRNPEILSYDWL